MWAAGRRQPTASATQWPVWIYANTRHQYRRATCVRQRLDSDGSHVESPHRHDGQLDKYGHDVTFAGRFGFACGAVASTSA